MNLTQYALAKLTLTLRILDKRDDGYNNLEALTVFLPEMHDLLEIVADEKPGFSRHEDSKYPMSFDEDNLIVKAFENYTSEGRIADLFADVKDVHINVTKNLPIAAGLGGGSADGAATLNLLNRYCDNELTVSELLWKAQELGSDIPACVYSQALWMKGRGEIVEPLDDFYLEDTQALILTPDIECSTKDVYAHYDKIGRPKDEGLQAPKALNNYCENLHNDLAIAAYDLFSELSEFKSFAEELTSLKFVLAGSGSSFFALSDPDQIQSSISKLESSSQARDIKNISKSELV